MFKKTFRHVLISAASMAVNASLVELIKRGLKNSPDAAERLVSKSESKPQIVVSPTQPLASYNPVTNTILTNGVHDPAVIAHELGHADGSRLLHSIESAQATQASMMLGSMFVNNKNKKLRYASRTAVNAASIFLLVREVDASLRGYRMMRKAGYSRLKSLKTFVGLPTYVVQAATVFLVQERIDD